MISVGPLKWNTEKLKQNLVKLKQPIKRIWGKRIFSPFLEKNGL